MMGSKGRRALRTPAPGAAPAEAEVPAENPIEAVRPIGQHIPADTSVSPTTPVAGPVGAPTPIACSDVFADFGRQNFKALIQSQTALARGLGALSAEITGLALSGIDAATRAATDVLAVRTFADALELNAGFTRRNFDTLIGGSAKLSELGVKVATEASQPILSQLGKDWARAARLALGPG
jgi:hypothetical protein